MVRRVRRALGERKIGHLGTLDPFATGLLPLCLGEATKLVPYLLPEAKTYRATIEVRSGHRHPGPHRPGGVPDGDVACAGAGLPGCGEIRR